MAAFGSGAWASAFAPLASSGAQLATFGEFPDDAPHFAFLYLPLLGLVVWMVMQDHYSLPRARPVNQGTTPRGSH